MMKPLPTVQPNTWEFLRDPMIAPTGFREYDARWKYPDDINLPGITALGLGLGTQMRRRGIAPVIAVGNDYRDYSLAIKNALVLGLMQAGIHVKDIGPALSPMAYFAQFHLDAPAVAMVTASHNPNGWTGVKMGFERPLTHGPDEMAELRDIVLQGQGQPAPGGGYEFVDGVREAYLDDLVGDFRMTRKLRVVCATGNGTASAFAPELFRRIRLKDPLKQKQLLKGLVQLSEEGAVQVFRPLQNNDLIVGAVGVLQFDVVVARLKAEYNVEAIYEGVNVATARWVDCSDEKKLEEFKRKNQSNLALDGGDNLSYIAPTMVNLNLAKERFPEVEFRATREH